MSWKVHDTDEVFAALRGLCSNSYRMYDPSEHRCYYDHDCETYECAVEEAAEEYERLVEHCTHQREQLAKLNERWMNGERTEEGAAMSITDELRVWGMGAHAAWKIDRTDLDCLHAIADLIDAEHKKAVERARMDGMDATFGDGWVKLPVDADGVPIKLGDNVALGDGTFEVRRLELYDRDSWDVLDRFGEPFSPLNLRHVQPDSWERIMDDAEKLARGDNAAVMELVERCRRLAGEGE